LEEAGHFSALENPTEVANIILSQRTQIERMTGQRREMRLRGRLRLDANVTGQAIAWQGELAL
jgi:hypothetical protein